MMGISSYGVNFMLVNQIIFEVWNSISLNKKKGYRHKGIFFILLDYCVDVCIYTVCVCKYMWGGDL